MNPINGTICAGQYLQVDDQEYKILAVGEEAPVTLAGLGHCSVRFNGSTTLVALVILPLLFYNLSYNKYFIN